MYYSNTIIQPEQKELSEIEKIERIRLLGSITPPDPKIPYQIRVAFYLRVSTGPQGAPDKASLKEQRETAGKTTEQFGWLAVREYQDIKETLDEENPFEREGLREALKDAEKGIYDVLIVWIDARLGRNSREVGWVRDMLRNYGVQVYSLKKPLPIIDPRFYNPKKDRFKRVTEGVNDLMSEHEMAEFSAKMEFGKMNKARNGIVPCKLGYGFRKKKRIKTVGGKDIITTHVVPVEKELQLVSEIFDMYLNKGLGIRKIVESLNSREIKTPGKSEKWCYSTVRYILKNPLYAGKVRWGWRLSQSRASRERLMKGNTGIVVDGKHKALISEEEFIKVQQKIQSRAKLGGRAIASKGLLVGLLKCGRCGSSAYITSYPSAYAYQMEKQGKPKEDYSRCSAYVCSSVSKYGNKACKRYIISQKKIEGEVVRRIRKLASSKTSKRAFQKEIGKDTTKPLKERIKILQKELNKFPERTRRYNIALGDGAMDQDYYKQAMDEIKREESKINFEINELQVEIDKSLSAQEKFERAAKLFENFDYLWEKASFDKKKDLIHEVVKKVKATADKIEIEFNY